MIVKCDLCGAHERPVQVIRRGSSGQVSRVCRDKTACEAARKQVMIPQRESVNALLYGGD